MMHMTFYWGTHVTLLVDAWKTTSLAGYSLTLFTCFLFSVFYQYLEDRRIRFKHVTSAEASSGIAASLLYKKLAGGCSTARLAGAALFGVNAAIGYLLMLSVMSYNGGVFVAVVIGLAVGYLIFRNGDEDVVVFDNPCPCA